MTKKTVIQSSNKYFASQLSHEKRARELRDQGSLIAPMPHTVSLAVNNVCFLRCKHCDIGTEKREIREKSFFYQRTIGNHRKIQEIPLSRLKKLVDEMAPHGGVIRPAFLEPLIRKDLFELATYSLTKGLKFSIQTNGVLLSKVYRQIVDTEIDIIRISLDGPAEIHDSIRGIPGTFKRVMDGLQKVIAYRNSKGLNHPNVGVSFVISGHNFMYINAFMDTLSEHGILEDIFIAFSLLRFITPREAKQQNELDAEFYPMTESSISHSGLESIDIGSMVAELERLINRFPRDKYKYHFFPTELNRKNLSAWFSLEDHFLSADIACLVPWSHCHIMYNGDVVINGRCCSPPLGNIMESSLEEIWNGLKAQKFRATLLELGNFPVCNRCCRKLTDKLLD